MRIINAIHAQSIGGVDQVFCNYTEMLVKKGHDVALLISDNGNDDYAHCGAEVFKLKNLSQISDLFRLLTIVVRFKPDVIICHSNRLMRWMKFLRFFKKIGFIHAKSVAVNHGISFKKSLHCDFIININQQISDLVVAQGFAPEHSFVLPNVIKVNQSYQEKIIRPTPTIAMYGRIENRKGFDILIQACALLAKKNYDFTLKMGGFEVEESFGWKELKALTTKHGIFDKCEFFGTVTDKKTFFKDVDIFCVPSREEPFGLVILESFLHSTIVVSSNTDGGKLLIEDEEDGLLFEIGDHEDLSQKLEKILTNPALNANITRKAFSKLVKKFSFDILGEKISKILDAMT